MRCSRSLIVKKGCYTSRLPFSGETCDVEVVLTIGDIFKLLSVNILPKDINFCFSVLIRVLLVVYLSHPVCSCLVAIYRHMNL